MEEVFGPQGLISQAHPEYEYRPGQVEMARAVMRAFEDRRHLIVEAGTGTGKTLAYLVPAILNRQRVLISPAPRLEQAGEIGFVSHVGRSVPGPLHLFPTPCA